MCLSVCAFTMSSSIYKNKINFIILILRYLLLSIITRTCQCLNTGITRQNRWNSFVRLLNIFFNPYHFVSNYKKKHIETISRYGLKSVTWKIKIRQKTLDYIVWVRKWKIIFGMIKKDQSCRSERIMWGIDTSICLWSIWKHAFDWLIVWFFVYLKLLCLTSHKNFSTFFPFKCHEVEGCRN